MVYPRKPPGLISQLRLLTTEAQRREIHLIAALEKNCIFLLLSNGRLRRSSSVRSLDSVVYSRKPPGLIFQLRLLTAETQSSQRREIHLITALEKGLHNCFLAIVVSVVRPLCALRLCGLSP